MKLMIAIIRDTDDETVVQELVQHGYRVTQMASTGGFLRRGNKTLMVGVEDGEVQSLVELLKQVTGPAESGQHRATIFVSDMPYFEKV